MGYPAPPDPNRGLKISGSILILVISAFILAVAVGGVLCCVGGVANMPDTNSTPNTTWSS